MAVSTYGVTAVLPNSIVTRDMCAKRAASASPACVRVKGLGVGVELWCPLMA